MELKYHPLARAGCSVVRRVAVVQQWPGRLDQVTVLVRGLLQAGRHRRGGGGRGRHQVGVQLDHLRRAVQHSR